MPLDRPVGPDAMCPFSTRTTRFTPRFASAYAVVHPLIPPPMMIASAVFDTYCLPSRASYRGPERFFSAYDSRGVGFAHSSIRRAFPPGSGIMRSRILAVVLLAIVGV